MDTIVNTVYILSSKTFIVTGVGLIVVPVTAGVAYGLTEGNKVISNKYNPKKKHFERAQQVFHSLDKKCRKCLQDGEFDQKEG